MNNQMVEERAPTNADLENIRRLQEGLRIAQTTVERLTDELRTAWLLVPFDPAMLRKPYQVDIKANCIICGKPTEWRFPPQGIPRHKDECPGLQRIIQRKANERVGDTAWNMLMDEEDDS